MSILSPSPEILYPAFALFALTAAVLGRLAWLRVGAIGRGEVSVAYYKTYDEGREPAASRTAARNFSNLLELPVLFYVVVILVYVTHQQTGWLLALAWLYVALRYVHTFVHLSSNNVNARFGVYLTSGIVLAVLWIGLLARLLSA